jgi:hypothetical protein
MSTAITNVTVTAVSGGDFVRLYHGSILASARSIEVDGLNRTSAIAAAGTGEFWATIDLSAAITFAQTATLIGIPIVLRFDLSSSVINTCLERNWLAIHGQGQTDYEFSPRSFSLVNRSMNNLIVSDTNFQFTE